MVYAAAPDINLTEVTIMQNLLVFKNDEFGTVRTVNIEGEPYFVGKDVAEIFKSIRSSHKTH